MAFGHKKKKQYKEGDVLATVTKAERKQMYSLSVEKKAIKASLTDLIEKVIDLEAENGLQVGLWWEKIRKKYNIPDEKDCLPENMTLTIWHNTGEIQVRRKRR